MKLTRNEIIIIFLLAVITVLFSAFIQVRNKTSVSTKAANLEKKLCAKDKLVGDYKGSYCDVWSKKTPFMVKVYYGENCEDIYENTDTICHNEDINALGNKGNNKLLPERRRSNDREQECENGHFPDDYKGSYCETRNVQADGYCKKVDVYFGPDCRDLVKETEDRCDCAGAMKISPTP